MKNIRYNTTIYFLLLPLLLSCGAPSQLKKSCLNDQVLSSCEYLCTQYDDSCLFRDKLKVAKEKAEKEKAEKEKAEKEKAEKEKAEKEKAEKEKAEKEKAEKEKAEKEKAENNTLKYIAVMELKNSLRSKKIAVSYLTNIVRQTASRLPHSKYWIMTRDNIQTMLPKGTTLEDCLTGCAVETARNINADWLVTGEIVHFENELRISLNLLHSKSGSLRNTQTVKGKNLVELETALQAASMYLFASIDPSLKKQAERIAGGFVFKKTILPDFSVKEAQITHSYEVQVKEPKSIEIPMPSFKAGGFNQSDFNDTHSTEKELFVLDEPLPMPQYEKDDLGKVSFANVNIEALQAYDSAVKGDQDENISTAEKIKRWKKVLKTFKKKKTEAKERIKVWMLYKKAEQKRMKLLDLREAKRRKIAQIRQKEQTLKELYEEAVRLDQDESSSVKDKVAQWKLVQKNLKSKKKEARNRIKAWLLYDKQRRAEQIRLVKAKKKRAAEFKKAQKINVFKLMRVYKKSKKDFEKVDLLRKKILKAEKKRRDQDWKKLSKLLPLGVVNEVDKLKWTIAFLEAYGVMKELNPYINDSLLKPYLKKIPPKLMEEFKIENKKEYESRESWKLKKTMYSNPYFWLFSRTKTFKKLKSLNITPVYIPGGSFTMGYNRALGRNHHGWTDTMEKPVYGVKVKTFYMSKTEITNSQYLECVKVGFCKDPIPIRENCWYSSSNYPNHPISCITFDEAKTFARWVGGYLPSEVQWEYAARSRGKNWEHPMGNHLGGCEYFSSHTAGCANEYNSVCFKPKGNTKQGLCDMISGVSEWVRDDFYNGQDLIIRGGSNRWYSSNMSTTHRDIVKEGSRNGFRIVWEITSFKDWFKYVLNMKNYNIKQKEFQKLYNQQKKRFSTNQKEILMQYEQEPIVYKDHKIFRSSDINNLKIEFIKMPSGSMVMSHIKGKSNEEQKRKVNVKSFYISKTEITVEQYEQCIRANVCRELYRDRQHRFGGYYKSAKGGGHPYHRYPMCNWGQSERSNHPINCISWEDARTFARWVGGDLPSEVQWEYAARNAGEDVKYPWGNESASCKYATLRLNRYRYNYWANVGCGYSTTTAVCSNPKGNTKQGICDMIGNVQEFTLDKYAPYDVTNKSDLPTCNNSTCESPSYSSRVVRGGSLVDTRYNSTEREDQSHEDRYYFTGFRVVVNRK